MTKKIFTIVLILLLAAPIFSQWSESGALPSNFVVKEFQFLSGTLGFAVSATGKIIRTTDAGATWIVKNNLNQSINTIRFANPFVGWLGGNAGSILRSQSQGKFWKEQNLSSPANSRDVTKIFSLNPNKLWAAGGEYVSRSIDGGDTWNSVALPINITDIFFTTDMIGWASGNDLTMGKIYKTTDGGATWNESYSSQFNLSEIEKVFFINDNYGWFAGVRGRLFKTTNGGANWDSLMTNLPQTILLQSLSFTDSLMGWIGGNDGTLLVTSDGGSSWASEGDGQTNWTAKNLHFPNATTGFHLRANKIFIRKSVMPVRLLSPNGGEKLVINTTHRIKFETNNVAAIDIAYSTDDGLNWNSVVSSHNTATGYYDWIVPGTPATNSRIKLAPTSADLNFVASEYAFAIVAVPPFVNITQPNGGEVAYIDSSYLIKWTKAFIDGVDIQLSRDNKATWETIVENYVADSLAYTVSVTSPQTEVAFIRIVDNEDSTIGDTSNAAFAIRRHVPAAPTLIRPVNAAVGVVPTDTLLWNSLPNILNYHLLFSNDSTFSSTLVDDTTLSATFYPLTQLDTLKKYYWKVRAKNEGGWGEYSSMFSFTAIGLPKEVQLNYPSNNSTGLEDSLTLNWFKAEEFTETISKYWVQLTTDTSSNTFVVNDSTLLDTSKHVVNLAYNTEHYWRVVSKNEHGWGNFSGWWKFKTLLPIPGAVVPYSPANGAVNLNLPVEIIWSNSTFAEKYHLQVATDSGFSNIIFNDSTLSDTSHSLNAGTLLNNQIYYWRARAWNATGFGEFLLTQNFHVIPAAPSAPNLLLPAQAELGLVPPVNFTWTPSATATHYEFLLTSDSSFASVGFSDSTLTDTFITVSQLNSFTKYYWKVRAKNAAGWGSYSMIFWFRTLGTPTIPQPISPANNAVDVPINLQFKWTRAADRFGETISKYWFQLKRDTNSVASAREDSSLVDTFYNVQSLENYKDYFWRTSAKNQAGWGSFSGWSKFRTIIQAPPQANLSSPANNAVNQPVTLTLRWLGISIAESYRLEVSSDQFFNSFFLLDSTLTDTFKVVTELEFNGLYYWRVRAKNVGGIGDWSDVWNFSTTLPKASLAFPDSGSIANELSILFRWNQTVGASKYHIQVATAPNFLSIIAEDTNVASLQKQFSDFPSMTYLYWRVRAGNAGGYGAFSNVWTFKTKGNPFQVELISPEDSSIHQPINLNFVWRKPAEISESISGKENGLIEGISKYWLEIKYDTSGSTVFVDSTISDTTTLVSNLQYLAEHYWRVRAMNEAGWGDYSSWFKFKTIIQAPAKIALASPDSGAVNQPIDITFNWFNEERTEKYEIEVSEDSLFASTVFSDTTLTDTTASLSGLDYLTNYFWRVRGKNIGGFGEFSSARKFTTIIERPNAPMLAAPDSGITGLVPPITVSWHPSERSEAYILEVSKQSDFSTIVYSDTNIVDTTKQLPSVDFLTIYYWRVRGKNIGGESDNSSAFNFKTVGLPSSINHVYPTANSVNIPIDLTFKWTRAFDQTETVSSYHFQLTKDTTSGLFTINDTTLTDTFSVVTGLENYTFYYWRVRAKNEFGWNIFTQWKRFRTIIQAPPAVVLVSPANGSTNMQTSIVFHWRREPISTKYHFELSDDSTFTTFTFRDTAIVDTFRGLPLLLSNNTKYFWRVRGTNIGGYGEYSSLFNFSTIVSAPLPPALQSPLNGAVGVPINLSLIWDSSAHSEMYYYQLSLNAGFTQLIASDSTISTSKDIIGLNYKTRYYWRVRARNISGFGNWSNIFNFLTVKRPVAAPTNLTAFNSGIMRVTLTWEDNSNNERNFVVQRKTGDSLSTEPFVELAVLDSNTVAYIDSIFLSSGNYTYRVYASSEDTISAYSNLAQLETISSVADILPGIPTEYEMKNNFPNPFNPMTNIRFGLPAMSEVKILIYNSVGEVVSELLNEELPAGNYNLKFTADRIPSGVYYCRVIAFEVDGDRTFSEVKKLILIK